MAGVISGGAADELWIESMELDFNEPPKIVLGGFAINPAGIRLRRDWEVPRNHFLTVMKSFAADGSNFFSIILN